MYHNFFLSTGLLMGHLGLISKIYKELNTTWYQTCKQSNFEKNGQRTWIDSENIQMFNRYLKRCSTSSIIREIQIKNHNEYHLTPVRMAIINKSTTIFVRMQRKGNLHALLVGLQICAVTMENSMEISQKIKNTTMLWPSNSTPKKSKALIGNNV